MSNRLLLLAQPNSYRIAAYIQAAQRAKIELVIASQGQHSLITEIQKGIHIDLDHPDQAIAVILQAAKENPFNGVLGSDDSTVELAAHIAQRLSLPHNPPQAARLSRRKDLARTCLQSANCLVPWFCVIDLIQPLEKQMASIPYPCVLKPLNLSASRGVIRADNQAAFKAACQQIQAIIQTSSEDQFEKTHLLVERYIEGQEIAFEGFLQNGQLSPLAIFDKPDPLTGPYFEERIYVSPSGLSQVMQAKVERRIQQACRAYGLICGPVHAELRIHNHDAWLLELASRTIGGHCARVLDSGLGFDLERLTMALAMGQSPDISTPKAACGVMMIPIPSRGLLRRVAGLSTARQVKNIESVNILIAPGHELIPLPEGNQYTGYIFAKAKTQQAVITALNKAHAKLHFVIDPIWDIRSSLQQQTR